MSATVTSRGRAAKPFRAFSLYERPVLKLVANQRDERNWPRTLLMILLAATAASVVSTLLTTAYAHWVTRPLFLGGVERKSTTLRVAAFLPAKMFSCFLCAAVLLVAWLRLKDSACPHTFRALLVTSVLICIVTPMVWIPFYYYF